MAMAAPPEGPPAAARPLRRDAQRNRDAIVAAARQLFCDHGLEAPLDEIARRAGVGIATTLYRRFSSRVELLDAVLADTLQAHIEAARRHLGILLDGFRAERASPLPEPPLSPRQVYRAMLVLGRRSAGTTDQHQRRPPDEGGAP